MGRRSGSSAAFPVNARDTQLRSHVGGGIDIGVSPGKTARLRTERELDLVLEELEALVVHLYESGAPHGVLETLSMYVVGAAQKVQRMKSPSHKGISVDTNPQVVSDLCGLLQDMCVRIHSVANSKQGHDHKRKKGGEAVVGGPIVEITTTQPSVIEGDGTDGDIARAVSVESDWTTLSPSNSNLSPSNSNLSHAGSHPTSSAAEIPSVSTISSRFSEDFLGHDKSGSPHKSGSGTGSHANSEVGSVDKHTFRRSLASLSQKVQREVNWGRSPSPDRVEKEGASRSVLLPKTDGDSNEWWSNIREELDRTLANYEDGLLDALHQGDIEVPDKIVEERESRNVNGQGGGVGGQGVDGGGGGGGGGGDGGVGGVRRHVNRPSPLHTYTRGRRASLSSNNSSDTTEDLTAGVRRVRAVRSPYYDYGKDEKQQLFKRLSVASIAASDLSGSGAFSTDQVAAAAASAPFPAGAYECAVFGEEWPTWRPKLAVDGTEFNEEELKKSRSKRLGKTIPEMNAEEVHEWARVHFPDCLDCFSGVDGLGLSFMSTSELKDYLGIVSLGRRKQIRKWVDGMQRWMPPQQESERDYQAPELGQEEEEGKQSGRLKERNNVQRETPSAAIS